MSRTSQAAATPYKAALKSMKALDAAKLVQVTTTKTANSVDVFIDGVGLPDGTTSVNLAVGGHKLRIRVNGDTGKNGKTELRVAGVVIGAASATVATGGRAWSANTPFNVPA